MNVLTILGSPRKSGNTASVLSRFEQAIHAEHAIQRINLIDYDLQGCLGCESCQDEIEEPGCIQEDDGPWIIQSILDADLVVYASPVYCWSFSAQMKALLDRQYCCSKWDLDDSPSLLKGKRVMLLATCAGSAEENFDLMSEQFKREADIFRCCLVGRYVVDRCSSPAKTLEKGQGVVKTMVQDFLGAAECLNSITGGAS